MRFSLTTVPFTDNAIVLYGADAKVVLACNNCEAYRAAVVVGEDVKVHTYVGEKAHDQPLRDLLKMLGQEAGLKYVCQGRVLLSDETDGVSVQSTQRTLTQLVAEKGPPLVANELLAMVADAGLPGLWRGT